MKHSSKYFRALLLGLPLLVGTTLSAQSPETSLFLDQLAVRTSPSATVLLAIVNGKIASVELGAGVSLNTSTSPATLTATLPAIPAPALEIYTVSAAAASYTLKAAPVANSLLVTRNGLVLSPGVDYTLGSAGLVSFAPLNGAAANPNAPQAGDLFTFYYAH